MKRTLSKRRGGYKKKKSIRRRRIMGGKNNFEKAVDRLRLLSDNAGLKSERIIENALRSKTPTPDQAIIQQSAKPYLIDDLSNLDDVVKSMVKYIKKERSTFHSIMKSPIIPNSLRMESDFPGFMEQELGSLQISVKNLKLLEENTNKSDKDIIMEALTSDSRDNNSLNINKLKKKYMILYTDDTTANAFSRYLQYLRETQHSDNLDTFRQYMSLNM
jgi:ClpP class serine protease